MGRARNDVCTWTEAGAIPPARLFDALRAAGVIPDAREWHRFLQRLLLGLGVLVVAASAVYFVAANWASLGRYAKLALAEGALVAAVAVAAWRGLDDRIGQAGLGAAALLTGVLLALVGQVYQTGADPWELFAVWAAVIFPWIAVGRMPVLWLTGLALLNLAVALYFVTFGRWFGLLFGAGDWRVLSAGLLMLNGIALALWEFAASRGARWLEPRWAPRLIATAAGVAATVLGVLAIVETRGYAVVHLALYALWLVAAYAWYRRVRLDLYVLAGGVLSVVVFGAAGLTRLLLRHGGEAGGLSLIALYIVVTAGAGALWLRRVDAEAPQ